MKRTILSSVCAVAGSVALTLSATPAHATPAAPGPDRTAPHSGLQRGQAYAGWSQRGSTGGTAGAPQAVNPLAAATRTLGIDVSGWQGNVDWAAQWNSGVRWAYTKATEGNYYTNNYFSQQYSGSYKQGMVRGAYHFAVPDGASAAAQAQYFVAHGGGWSRDGKTLPGMLDIEYNPYGATCYGLSQSAMVTWIRAWLTEYKRLTTRDAPIYTTYDWWNQCTGNSTAFNQTNPLWIAKYSTTPGTIPGGWSYYTMWQYTDTPLDKNWFNGDLSRVVALANG